MFWHFVENGVVFFKCLFQVPFVSYSRFNNPDIFTRRWGNTKSIRWVHIRRGKGEIQPASWNLNKLFRSLQVILFDEDEPHKLCDLCYSKCQEWKAFQAQAIESERVLRHEKEAATFKIKIEPADELDEDHVDYDNDMPESVSYIKTEAESSDGPWELQCSVDIVKNEILDPDEMKNDNAVGISTLADHNVKSNDEKKASKPAKRENLDRHQRVHNGSDRPFKCEKCPRTFNHRGTFNRHKLIHERSKRQQSVSGGQFKCALCSRSFLHKYNLKRHESTHSPTRPFKCPECDWAFKSKFNLSVHMRNHTAGERRLKCELCPKTFLRQQDKDTHQRIHTGERPFQCDKCDKNYTRNSDLKYHRKRSHLWLKCL